MDNNGSVMVWISRLCEAGDSLQTEFMDKCESMSEMYGTIGVWQLFPQFDTESFLMHIQFWP